MKVASENSEPGSLVSFSPILTLRFSLSLDV